MKKTKILSLLLCLSLFCALIVPCTTAYAEGETKSGSGDNGMKISKTATANPDGSSYTITLEAFATGEKTTQTTDVPTDIVLVLDQSGSMNDPIGGYTYTEYQKWSGLGYRNYHNDEYYPLRHNNGSENLWHKLNDNEYVAVSVEQNMGYAPISNWNNWEYYENRNNLYCLVNEEYKKVSVSKDWKGTYNYDVDGKQIGSGSSSLGSPTFNDGYAPLYQSVKEYTYSYTLNGTKTVIEKSDGDGSSPNTQFYSKGYSDQAGGSRLNALQNAATTFVNAVAAKAAGKDGNIDTPDDNVDHRIAVVGYASRYDSTKKWKNTEVFVGANQYNYSKNASQYYGSAFQNMSTTEGKHNITASIDALDADGATYTNYGLEMANGILNANPVPNGETRNRVIVLFTDGYPGQNANDFNSAAANAALKQATTAKNNGVSLYSVGIFSGADATTAGDNNGSNTDAANWFMQQVSSNNGTPRSPSYYLSAADAGSLNSIFQQISSNIGGSSTTLDSKTVVKDVISPYFTLPAGTTARDIQIDTYACTGKTGNTYTWSGISGGPGGASATVSGDQVSVTGFDFSKNWCGTETNAQGTTTVRGKKLVISFTVDPKSDFLGGNDVITNASAGIYENGSAQTPVMTFEQPKVNVPIKKVTVTATDKNVYLKGEVTADQLKDGSEISVGDVELDLTKDNYGLKAWQTKYVNITVEVKDNAGNVISDKLDNLTDDTTYTVSVTVAPKTDGTDASGEAAEAKTGANSPANINVFKPELTFKDSEVYYGDNVPTDYSGNLVSTKWFHTQTVDDQEVKTEDRNVTMVGAPDVQAPVLSVEYTPDANKIKDGRIINTKDDIPVAATVKIGPENINEHTTFVHQNCNSACDWNETDLDGNPAFLLHVKTCKLTITKQGGADGEPYVFDIYKDDDKYSEVTVKGNGTETLVELPVGTYTIKEDTGWSWRFNPNPSYSGNVILSKDNTSGTITCTNTKNNDQWLNGFSDVVKNIFDGSHNN